MPANYSRVDAEIARGRLWRAKDILVGRMANSSYDAELFGRLAIVLDAMHDEDEAGRFHFLAGASTGRQAALARSFLHRRSKLSLENLWQTMPKAARRRAPQTIIPPGTIDHLKALNKLTDMSQLAIEVVDWSPPRRSQTPLARSRPGTWRNVFAWFLIVSVATAIVLGFIEIGRIILWAISKLI